MTKIENDLDIYEATGNANTQRQENEIAAIINKRIILSGKISNLNINDEFYYNNSIG